MRAMRVWTALTALVVWGCASSPPERFYALTALAPAIAPTAVPAVSALPSAPLLHVAIDPVSVPQMVDRTDMVFEGPAGEVAISEADRWAEPLKVGIGRVLAEDLSARLPGARVTAASDQSLGMPAIRVTLAVQQWQVHSGQALRITGLWTVRKTSETTSDGVSSAQREGRWVVERPIEGRAVNAAVRSESEAIAELSRPIAEAIAELTATKGF